MLLNSFSFIVFFTLVLGVYWRLPAKGQWIWLLFTSYIFYAFWNLSYGVLICLITLIAFYAGRGIATFPRQKRSFLVVGTALIASALCFFKYFPAITVMLRWAHPASKLLLPLGISFYTFQALSYIFDVYRGKVPVAKHFWLFASFICFFPQLAAGPIERASKLLPQIIRNHHFLKQPQSEQLKAGNK